MLEYFFEALLRELFFFQYLQGYGEDEVDQKAEVVLLLRLLFILRGKGHQPALQCFSLLHAQPIIVNPHQIEDYLVNLDLPLIDDPCLDSP